MRAEAEAETARQTTRFMVDLFKVSDPSEALGNTITAREILDKGAARIDTELADQPAIQATLMDTMGTVYTSLGPVRLRGAAGARSARQAPPLLGPQRRRESRESLNHLGDRADAQSDYAEAEQRLREALAIRARRLGNNSAEVADDALGTGGRHVVHGRVRQGRADDRGSACGSAGSSTATRIPTSPTSLGDLGVNFGERGDFKQANAYLREALAMQRKLHGSRPSRPGRGASTISPGH